ncbi:hypothetical protein GCM10009840_21340 [Pseudolysinimonas kribbensis]
MSRLSRLRDRVVTADAVYGTILYAALIAVSAAYEHAGDGVPGDQPNVQGDLALLTPASVDFLQVLEWSVTTLIVFWIAHVYARTIAGHGMRSGEDRRLGVSFRHALAHSNGMLWSAIPATVVVLLGAAGVLPDAADWALVVNVLVLGVLGYQSLSERRRPVPLRILGGVVTALLGLAIILLDIAMH